MPDNMMLTYYFNSVPYTSSPIPASLKASEQVRVIGQISGALPELKEKRVCVFVGLTSYRECSIEEYDYSYAQVTKSRKAVVVFSSCDTKTKQIIVDVGKTHIETAEWLQLELEDGVQVDCPEYGIYKNEVRFDETIPF